MYYRLKPLGPNLSWKRTWNGLYSNDNHKELTLSHANQELNEVTDLS